MSNDAAGAVDTISPPQQDNPQAGANALADHMANVREDAIAAIKNAVAAEEGTQEGTQEAAAPKEKEKPKKAPKEKAEKAATKEAPAEDAQQTEAPKAKSIAEVLAEREEKATAKRAVSEAKAERDRIMAEVQAAKDAVAKERAALEQEMSRGREFLTKLRQDPKSAIREAGWNGDDLILDLAKDGTPEGQIARQLRQQKAEYESAIKAKDEQISSIGKKLDEFMSSLKERETKDAEQAQRAGIQQAERQFIDFAMGDKCPTLAKAFKGAERMLINEAHEVAREYRVRTGQQLSPADVAEYLEYKFASQFGTQEQASSKQGNGSQLKPRASATVTTADASEKRTSGKPIEAMTDEERREAAKQAVKRAVREAESAKRDADNA